MNIDIDCDKVKEICTNISFYDFETFTNKWYKDKDIKSSLNIIFSIYNKGYSVMDILDSYFIFIKYTDIVNEVMKYKIIKIICQYISIFHNIHESEIELALFTNNLIKLI